MKKIGPLKKILRMLIQRSVLVDESVDAFDVFIVVNKRILFILSLKTGKKL